MVSQRVHLSFFVLFFVSTLSGNDLAVGTWIKTCVFQRYTAVPPATPIYITGSSTSCHPSNTHLYTAAGEARETNQQRAVADA